MANIGYIQITRDCNQDCRFCSNPPSGRGDLEFEKVKKLVDSYIKKDYEEVILTGGEPTLHKDLPKIISYCKKNNFPARIITNGQKIADEEYLRKLIDAGLKNIHLSIYSHTEVQNRLTNNKDSLQKIRESLDNLSEFNIDLNINTVINKKNADHLSDLVKFLINNYPSINHFVFNNLDPRSERAQNNKDTIPDLTDFEVELHKALKSLEEKEVTFRVERVPLCYMPEFEYSSTETRKIVKNEVRPIQFLDEKEALIQRNFFYNKPEKCKKCSLNSICAGLYSMKESYSPEELAPVFISKEKIVQKVLRT